MPVSALVCAFFEDFNERLPFHYRFSKTILLFFLDNELLYSRLNDWTAIIPLKIHLN